jgi:hypothetical protein
MNKLSKYNDFLIEKEFNSIVKDILTLVESNTFEWDLTDKNKDKNQFSVGDTIEWDINPTNNFELDVEKQSKSIKDYVNSLRSGANKVKSGLGKVKSKLHKFKTYVNEADPDIEFDIKSVLFKKIEEFTKGLNTKEQVKEYFFKLVDKLSEELKELSDETKKDLFVKLSVLIMSASSLNIGDLISDQDASEDKFLSDIKTEAEVFSRNKVEQTKPIENKEEVANKSYATFDNANKLVSLAEGGYTDNPIDAGNWTNGPDSKSGHLIGTNRGIAAFTIIKTNTKPTSDAETSALKQGYGRKYEKFCGKKLLSFGEQWRLDQKYIDSKNIGIKWKNIQKALEKETATEIYENEYWNLHDFSKIKSQSIANILYDACVNQGPGVPGNVFISSMKELGYNVNGVNTWDEIHSKLTPIVNSMNTNQLKKLHHKIGLQRLQKYGVNKSEDEMTADEKEFSNGWKNRINKEGINKFEEGGIS